MMYLVLILSVVINGVSFLFMDIIAEHYSATDGNIISFAVAVLVLVIACFVFKKSLKISKSDILKVGVSGVLGTAMFYYLSNLSLRLISPAAVSAISGTVPIITILIACIFLKNKFRLRYLVGLTLTSVGIILVTGVFSNTGEQSYLGIILMLICNLSWVIFTMMNEKLLAKYDALPLLTWQLIFGLAFLLVMKFATGETGKLMQFEFTTSTIIAFLYLGVVTLFLAYFFYIISIKKLGVEICSFYMNLIPVVTFVVGVIMKFEQFTVTKLLGIIAILISVIIVSYEKKSRNKANISATLNK